MKHYLVIGYYEHLGETFTVDTHAKNSADAMKEAADFQVSRGLGGTSIILGAIEATSGTAIKFCWPSQDDNNKAIYAIDLVEESL